MKKSDSTIHGSQKSSSTQSNMGLDILDDMLPFGSTKTEQNVGKFAPKPGGKSKKPLSKKAKPSNVPNAVEVALGKDANIATSDLAAKTTELGDLTSVVDADLMKLTPVEDTSKLIGETEVSSGQSSETISNATMKPPDSEHSFAEDSIQAAREPLVLAESSHVSEENEEVSAGFESSELEADPLCHSSTVARKCDVYQSGSQCSESETSLPRDSDNIQQDLDLMAMSVSPSDLTVKQCDKFQPKSALRLKGPKNKSVSFSLPVETEKLPSHKQGLDSLDLNVALEPVEGNLSNKEDSLANIATEHADFPDNDEEFESIDEIMNIDSWDEPSIPTKLENDGANRTSGGSSKRSSTGKTFENDIHTNIDSEDMEDLNESNDDDDDGILTTNDMNGTKKTTKSKGNSSKKSDPKKLPDNDEEFESIDEIMNMDSWDEPFTTTKLENDGTDKTSRGSRKRNSTRTFENDDHTKYDSAGMEDLNESNDNDDDWTTNDMNDNKKTTKKKRKSPKESDPVKIPNNDEEFESIDEIMNFDSWDEPSIPTLENSGTDKTSGGSRKRYSTRRTFGNVNHTNNDGGDMGNLKKLNDDDDDDWTANNTNDTQKTTKRKRKSSKESNSKIVKEPKKKIPHGTRRKRRQVEKPLLEKVEHGIDPTQLPIRDLILIAEAKERILSKEAAVSMLNSNNDSHADHDNPLDEGFDPDSEEAHRHRLKHARKVNYHTHMNISRSPRWSKEDTELFFEAVRNFKTSFEMMVWLFPGRTPRQLKAKFKAEERKHPLELHDALDFRSKDHTLFSKVIQIMKEQKKAEDDAANEVEEEIGQLEKEENAGTASNHKADNSDKTDPWNDCDFDFNEPADLDLELDAAVSFTQNREEKVDSEKEKQTGYNCEDDAKNSEKKDLWDDDFDMLEFNDCEDLELETDFASTQFEEKK